MKIADSIEPLDHDGEKRQEPNQKDAVLLVMTEVLQAIAILGVIEALVLDFPAALGHAEQGVGADAGARKVGEPVGLVDRPAGLVLAIADDAHGFPAQGVPRVKVVGVPDFHPILPLPEDLVGRLVTKALLGRRFADYVVVDGNFARAPFLHDAGDLGLFVVARLKNNLPELFTAAQKRFLPQAPHHVFRHGKDRVEIWDADDFDPWETLRWETVRVVRYRQYRPDGTVCEAYWLTNFPRQWVSSQAIFRMAKSRWEIENEGFNDAKNRYGFEHICHHEQNSLLLCWLLTCLALTIERLYRIRYLHRGTHPILEAADLCQLLWLSLSRPVPDDTS